MNRKAIICIGLLSLLTAGATVAQASDRKKNSDNDITYKEIKEVEIDPSALDDAQKVCLDVVSSIDEAAVDTTEKKEPPKANISLNALIDANANYAKDNMIWENRLKLSYGFIQSFDKDTPFNQQFDKSDDRIQLDSKWGWQLVDKLYFSALFNFRTQMTPTYEFVTNEDGSVLRNVQSKFMAPGYVSLGLGINYKPFNFLSLNLSPATGNLVVVTEESLRKTYGNAIDQPVRAEFGAQFKMDINYAYKIFKISSALTLFSNYLENPDNIQVYWDVDASLAITKILTLTLRTNLIWDENINFTDAQGKELPPMVQFKEIVSLGLTWTFGQYVKPE